MWFEANRRFHEAVRAEALALIAAFGPEEAHRRAREKRDAAPEGDERLFAYNVELRIVELAGLDRRGRAPAGAGRPLLDAERLRRWQVAAERLMQRLFGPPAPLVGRPAAVAAALTDRQIECLRWVAEGKSSWDIAQILGLSPKTVDFHLDNACERLGVRRRIQAAVIAADAGLLVQTRKVPRGSSSPA